MKTCGRHSALYFPTYSKIMREYIVVPEFINPFSNRFIRMTSVWQSVDIKRLDEQKIEWEKLLDFYAPTELIPNVHIMTSILLAENELGGN